jgi:hypothetical protein
MPFKARYLLLNLLCAVALSAADIDLKKIPLDLTPPPITEGEPAAGRRVLQALPEYQSSSVRHTLFLPTNWQPGQKFPVIVEYSGNGRTVAGGQACLGYGASGGRDFIWVCLPFVTEDRRQDTATWWGDVAATVRYCQAAVAAVCTRWGGDPRAVFLAGFSRGAIACNVIGLHDAATASLWRGMICHSHYDDGRWKGTSPVDAAQRLARLGQIPQFITNERPVAEKERIAERLTAAKPDGAFTFVTLPFPDHTEDWILRDLPARAQLRDWLQHVLTTDRPLADIGTGSAPTERIPRK